ncbi:uncharacterized protein LOC114540530 [Dendronephthya gigantea]|uniref:uncharacterized protein LOC114540530 n=1 Tax=Dendronephthya gigantea TaxID=151771 RepID=UPI0010699781|nr:uncharacterized protein LOC114540530 [Dendronephthya gigantea]
MTMEQQRRVYNMAGGQLERSSDINRETWLSNDVPDEAVHLPGLPQFNVLRNDREYGNGFQERIIKKQCQLKQLVKDPTRRNATLDLVFTNIHQSYEKPTVLAPLGNSDHCMIELKSKDYTPKGNQTRKVTCRPIQESSVHLFHELITRQSWSSVYDSCSVNSKVEAFLNITNDLITKCFPIKTFKRHENDKPFISGRIKSMIIKRDKLYQQGRMVESREMRNKIISEIRKEKSKLYNERIKPLRVHEPKAWWKNVKKIVRKKKQEFSLTDPESAAPLNSRGTAEHINNFFTNLTTGFSVVNNEWTSIGNRPLPNIPVDSVLSNLRNLNVNKAAGPHDPDVRIIKYFAEHFAFPLAHIFNESFKERVFPDIWKISNVCAIPKTKPCCSADELRPVALTSVLSKIQESYVNSWIIEDAFDLIDHNKLLESFLNNGVRPELVAWLASYLQGRSQITFQGERSSLKRINGGVPQGTKLGPISFILKINDLPMKSKPITSEEQDVTMFMDDTTSYEVIDVSSHTSGSPIGISQEWVDKVIQFTRDEMMELNGGKCKEMIIDFRKNKTDIPAINIGGCQVARVLSYKLLGVWIDDDLKWRTNTEYIVKKATKRLHFLKILRRYGAPIEDLLMFYCTVIRSVLEYGMQIWSGGLTKMQRDNIERV